MSLQEPTRIKNRLVPMTKGFCAVLSLVLILGACTPTPLAPPPLPSTSAADIPSPGIPASATSWPPALTKLVATLSTPHIDQPPDGPSTLAPTSSQGCAYRWAYQDLPDLSSDFQSALQELLPGIKGYAFAFGEDCIHADGTVTFLPMETDFNSTLPVSDLSDEAELGNLIIRVMQVIETIPPEQIRGPRPGRVSLLFEAGADRTGVSFYIDQYRALPADLTSAEIFRTLKESQ